MSKRMRNQQGESCSLNLKVEQSGGVAEMLRGQILGGARENWSSDPHLIENRPCRFSLQEIASTADSSCSICYNSLLIACSYTASNTVLQVLRKVA